MPPFRLASSRAYALAVLLTLSLASASAVPGIASAQDLDELLQPGATSQIEKTVGAFGPGDVRKTELQRERVADLARRRLGLAIGRDTESDLSTLQRLLDGGHVRRDDTFMLQSLGVVLGDALDRDLRILQWAVVDDKYGHSRALQYRTTDQVFFPVTMISKRVEHGERVDVRALYAQVKTAAEALEANREEHLRRSRGRR